MKFLIKTKQTVLNQTWLVKGFSLICMRGRRGFAECPVWLLAVIPTSWKFLILTAYAQQTLHNLCFHLRKRGISVRLSTLSFIICLRLFSLVFLYGRMCCIGNPQTNVCCPWEVLLPWVLSKILPRTSRKTNYSLKGSKTYSFFPQCLCHSKMQLPHVWLVCVHPFKGWEVSVGCGGLCSGLSIYVT